MCVAIIIDMPTAYLFNSHQNEAAIDSRLNCVPMPGSEFILTIVI